MPYQFRKHYSLQEARALLPQVRDWLRKLQESHAELAKLDSRITQLMGEGADLGGDMINSWVKTACSTKRILEEFSKRQIQVKDLNRGLLDFPSLRGNREVFLCWEQDEEDIEFWHELDSGYAGRERL